MTDAKPRKPIGHYIRQLFRIKAAWKAKDKEALLEGAIGAVFLGLLGYVAWIIIPAVAQIMGGLL